MFSIVILMGLLAGVLSETAHNGSFDLDVNCTVWLPVNVTDMWDSCGVQHKPAKAWRCGEKSDERLLIMFGCTPSKCTAPEEIQIPEEPTKGQIKLRHDMLLIFLYGAASGAGLLLLLILLLSTVRCYLLKRKKTKSKLQEVSFTPVKTPDDGNSSDSSIEEGDYIASNLHLETQNENRHEVVVYENVDRNPDTTADEGTQALIPPPSRADTENGDDTIYDDSAELVDKATFERGCIDQEKPSKIEHPLYVNSNLGNEGSVYMHLLSETREKDDSSNVTKEPATSTKEGRAQTLANKESSARPPAVKKKPTRSQTAVARPPSAEYVNCPLKNLYCNDP